ncbi:MAG: SDR family NAD(P)-dependent oxidoreductase [Proteobacteria bacterium]|nr:SDR family NAD(P)-dependent oxidoreductase [Pseudomonadota bacterium]
MANLGRFGGAGVLLILVYTLVVIPPLLALLPIRRYPSFAGRHPGAGIDRVLTGIADFATRRALGVVVASAVVVAVAASGLVWQRFGHDTVAWLPRSLEIRQAVDRIDGSTVTVKDIWSGETREITDVDPLKYDLLFERFLNPQRVTQPDIDIDFCYERRGEVIEYVIQKYGQTCVAQIITFGTMQAKAVVRDVARVMKLSYTEADRLAKLIPNELDITLSRALAEVPELTHLYRTNEQVKQLMEIALVLEGLTRHASTHAAGITIADRPLTEYVPLFKSHDDQITTGFDMKALEAVGLRKIDMLGLRTLTVIDETVKLIEDAGGRAAFVRADVSKAGDVEALVEQAIATFGRLDYAHNNAGVLGTLSPLGHIEPADWAEVLDVNLTANWRLIRSLDPLLRQSDAGRAIFVTSGAAASPHAYWGAYAVSKAALEMLVETYAAEITKTNVRANLLDPGALRTAMRAAAFPGEDPETLPAPEAITAAFVDLAEPGCTRNGEVVRAY